jgi:hypothetical protein
VSIRTPGTGRERRRQMAGAEWPWGPFEETAWSEPGCRMAPYKPCIPQVSSIYAEVFLVRWHPQCG